MPVSQTVLPYEKAIVTFFRKVKRDEDIDFFCEILRDVGIDPIPFVEEAEKSELE